MFECFHPTLVLAQHIFNFNSIEELKFPSHIGSRSTEHKNRLEAVQRRFPSHIGSRSTDRTQTRYQSVTVSIPHWFSLNLDTT